MRKIGIFGGTFNPIHNGHLNLISSFQKEFNFDEVLLIPTNIPPHKDTVLLANGEDRVNMCRLAVENWNNITVSEIEFERKDKSYSFVTLTELKKLYKDAEFYFIMGSDMFLSLKTWYRYDELKELAVFCTAAREENEFLTLKAFAQELENGGANCCVLNIDVYELSSTQIRENILFDENCSDFLPKKVYEYIKEKNIYSFDVAVFEYKKILKERLSQSRYYHSLCVADSAVMLSKKYGANVKKAFLAGLLHDITKQDDEKIQLQIMETSAIICDRVERKNKPLWHAITGAWYLENVLGIKDREVLDSVRWHTEFRANATLLDKIIYLADFISADRDYKDVEIMRDKCNSSLEEGLLYGLSYTIKDNAEKNKPIGIESVKAYNSLLGL